MIKITNDPVTGLERKLTYDFHWFQSTKQIIIDCTISYFKNNIEIDIKRVPNYKRTLVASDSLVYLNGVLLTPEENEDYKSKIDYNSSYEGLMVEYNTKLEKYLIDLSIYNELMIQYYVDLENYYNQPVIESPMLPTLDSPSLLTEPTIPIAPIEPIKPNDIYVLPQVMTEYDFYAYVLGANEIILPTIIEQIILTRDSEGKFDI